MRKIIFIMFIAVFMVGCGMIGIGSNHNTLIYNNSKDVITVSSESGVFKINPDSSTNIYSTELLSISNSNKKCVSNVNIIRKLNTPAVILDVFPGIALGIIPIFVDAVTNNLYRMPQTYSYSC